MDLRLPFRSGRYMSRAFLIIACSSWSSIKCPSLIRYPKGTLPIHSPVVRSNDKASEVLSEIRSLSICAKAERMVRRNLPAAVLVSIRSVMLWKAMSFFSHASKVFRMSIVRRDHCDSLQLLEQALNFRSILVTIYPWIVQGSSGTHLLQ